MFAAGLCKARKNKTISFRRWLTTQYGSPEERTPVVVVNFEKALEELRLKGNQCEGYAELLRLASERRSLSDGKLVHDYLVRSGYAGDSFLGNLLVDMYGKCGDLEAARAAFERIRDKNIFSWTILLTAFSKSFHSRAVLKLVQQMDLEGIKAEKITFLGLVDSCAKLLDLKRAKEVHSRIAESGWDANLVVGNAIVSMYGRCGDVQTSRAVFEALEEKSVVSWNAVIGAYARNGHGKEALEMLKRMDLEGVEADRITFLSVVEACTCLGVLGESRLAYARIVASGLNSDIAVGTSLVNMLGKSGSLADAKAAFDDMQRKNVVTWNVMIQTFNQSGRPEEALRLFRAMMEADVEADKVTFINAIEACVGLKLLSDGREIHLRITSSGLESELVMGNALMNMYGKCASPADARNVFNRMVLKDVVSWNTLIASYARNGFGEEGMKVFQEMVMLGTVPDKYTLISALDACCGLERNGERKGREIHQHIKESGFMNDVAMVTGLIKMYGKFGLVLDARRVFDAASRRVTLTWSRMITAYGQNGYGREAIELYKQMDVPPDKVTFASVLDACSSVLELEEGRKIHARIVEGNFEKDIVVDNTLLDLYGLCGSLAEAEEVFSGMRERDVISWNAIIRAHLFSERYKEALGLFYEMEDGGVKRDRVSYVSALDACSGIGGSEGLVHGKTLHGMVVTNKVHLDVFVGTALVTMYGRCGSMEDARVVFQEMRCRNAVSWTSMLRGFSANGLAKEAMAMFFRMELEGCEADKVTLIAVLEVVRCLEDVEAGRKFHQRLLQLGFGDDPAVRSALVGMYGRCGSLEMARSLFNGMRSNRCVVSWNAMISAYAKRGEKQEVLRLFEEMKASCVKPDRATYLGILNAGMMSGFTTDQIRRLQECISDDGLVTDCLVGTALLNIQTRLGKLAEARLVFDGLLRRDVVSWTSMIMAYASHGEGEEAVDLFQEMQLDGTIPDDIVFIGVLFACNHAGKFRQGWEYFVSMRGDYEIQALADHYCCVVDLLGRAGKLGEAEELIVSMPFKPDEATWTALVGACKLHGDVERADRLSQAMESDDQVAPHVLLCNTFAAC